MNCLLKLSIVLLAASAAGYATPVHLRCEHLNTPLGIDALHPLLSWQSDNTERNWHQSAYQILVATSTARWMFGTTGSRIRRNRRASSTEGQILNRAAATTGPCASGTRPASNPKQSQPGGKWACWQNPTGAPSGSVGNIRGRKPTAPPCDGLGSRAKTLAARSEE